MKRLVIITGANSGIGKAAAHIFAKKGYHVIMACRNLERSEPVRKEIITESGNSSVELWELDVSSFNSIKHFCAEYTKKFEKLDILIHNAGYFNHGEKEYQFSPDGIELSFAANAFGPFLMTMLLKEQLSKSDDPRVLNACTTNIKHFLDPKRNIEYDNLRGELRETRKYNVYKLYGDSKMALMMLTIKLAEEFQNESIKVNAVLIPGIRQSKESRKKFRAWNWRLVAAIMQPFLRTPERMAETYFEICTSENFRNVSGKLVNIHKQVMGMPKVIEGEKYKTNPKELWRMTEVPAFALRKGNIERIWNVSQEVTGNYLTL
jgi:NAD(P)-dependent dehydrogenase (short-subunit alcohol dehydrogenase family)